MLSEMSKVGRRNVFNAGDEIEILGKKEFFGQLQLQGVLEGKITSV